jgi:hypothetical protein
VGGTFTDYDRLVPLRSGLNPSDAHLIKSILTANGIEVFLHGEHASTLQPGVFTDVMIRAVDKVRADSVLDKVSTMPSCKIPRYTDADGEEQACEHCGSTFVAPYVGNVASSIPGVKIAAGVGDGWFHCRQCDSHYCSKRSRYSGMPLGIAWAGTVGGFVFALYWFIDWLKWL